MYGHYTDKTGDTWFRFDDLAIVVASPEDEGPSTAIWNWGAAAKRWGPMTLVWTLSAPRRGQGS